MCAGTRPADRSCCLGCAAPGLHQSGSPPGHFRCSAPRASCARLQVLQRLRHVKGVALEVPWQPLRALLGRQLLARTQTYESECTLPRLFQTHLTEQALLDRPLHRLPSWLAGGGCWQGSSPVAACIIETCLRRRSNDAAAGGGRGPDQAHTQAAPLLPSRCTAELAAVTGAARALATPTTLCTCNVLACYANVHASL